MDKIIIDLHTILEPYKFSLILSKINKEYEKILIPKSIRLIEIGLDKLPLDRFDIFSDSDFTTMERLYNHWGEILKPDNLFIGLRLLKMAEGDGHIEFFNDDKFSTIGRNILSTSKPYPSFYRKNAPGNRIIRIHPDFAYTSLDGIIGAQATYNATTVLGDHEFAEYVRSKKPKGTIFGDEGTLNVICEQQSELKVPQLDSIDQLYYLAVNDDLIKKKFLQNLKTEYKEVLLMSLEFGSTLTADTYLFGGIPITSGTLFGYKLFKNLFYIHKNKK